MLNWSQDQLATNASVSRATVADFESNTRRPMKNNIRSIADSMFAAGIEFVPEEGTKGVGVRFRERKLEYVGSARINRFDNNAAIRMRYAGEEFVCVIDLDAVDDHYGDNFSTDDQYAEAISAILHIVLAAAERHAPTQIDNGRLLVTYDMLQDG
ncbi:MAG: helix-turn-helix transcriptional regulator [Roseicyclus sp.]